MNTPMTWNTYWPLARRTESIPNNQYGKIEGEDANNVATRLLHAAMGLVTETQELSDFNGDRVNLVEELGDCFWYLVIIENTLQYNLVGVVIPDPLPFSACVENMKRDAAELLNLIGKRHIFYGKSLEVEQVKNHTRNYLYWLMAACVSKEIEIEETWEANIKKLEKRYPKLRFDETDAVERDTVNELSHINTDDPGFINPSLAPNPAIIVAPNGEKITLEPSPMEVQLAWGTLKAGIFIHQSAVSPFSTPKEIQDFVLQYLNCTKEYAEAVLDKELKKCQFQCVQNDNVITFKAIPFSEDSVAPVVITSGDAFNLLVLEHYTSDQIEKMSMTAAFLMAQFYRSVNAVEIARAYDSLYSTYSGVGNKLNDHSLWAMYDGLNSHSQLHTVPEILSVLNLWSTNRAAASSSV